MSTAFSPDVLIRAGITKDLLADGTTIAMDANPAENGSSGANSVGMTFADGYRFAPSAAACMRSNCVRIWR
jgi:hypothetical protein